MSVVGIIFPIGYFFVDQLDEDVTLYRLPIQLSHPFLTYDKLPKPDELCDEFDRIVEDVEDSHQRGHIVPQPGAHFASTEHLHLSYLEVAFYKELHVAPSRQAWHQLLDRAQGKCQAQYQFDRHHAFDLAALRP